MICIGFREIKFLALDSAMYYKSSTASVCQARGRYDQCLLTWLCGYFYQTTLGYPPKRYRRFVLVDMLSVDIVL